jgi:hypothetical protein
MRIENSNILLQTSRSYIERHEKEESLRIWTGGTRPDFEGLNPSPAALSNTRADMIDILEKAGTLQSQKVDGSDVIEPSAEDKLKISIIERLIEALTGKKIEIKAVKIQWQDIDPEVIKRHVANPAQSPARKGWGVEYDYHESHYEHESMSFDAQGIIKTADDKEIKISLRLAMNREFMSQQNISLRLGDAVKVDPLVINFGGTAVQLMNAKFDFDLNADGKKEKISFAGPGSGFLTLDINYDGIVNDGSELFGPKNGDGFADLSGYDSDGNMWMDENDFIFNRLKIWSKDTSGKDMFYTLKDKNIGALYLGNIAGQFNIKDSNNISHGEIKTSGIYLTENGSAGTIQQIDLTA